MLAEAADALMATHGGGEEALNARRGQMRERRRQRLYEYPERHEADALAAQAPGRMRERDTTP